MLHAAAAEIASFRLCLVFNPNPNPTKSVMNLLI